ncbi:hypothetical protein IM45_317 [Candidatus Palibaumannia cicadellinicola]|uniref:Uncharacterized protein n=1 Tax=Candidatus Palibaumannia cicadellinicola TaxID=186490 RepID=A0A088N108_9GAMM|nr:hypothetical protein IM45_317 [Candidatus Baumannia cicadellinicola]
MRFNINQLPLKIPNLCIASIPYCEHVGQNLQWGINSGLIIS